MAERVGDLLATPEAGAPVGDDRPRPPGAPGGMPGLKATQAPARTAQPRRARARGAGRSRMRPTHRQVHAVSHCPLCAEPLTGGTIKRTREVIEVPRAPAVVTEHVDLERR